MAWVTCIILYNVIYTGYVEHSVRWDLEVDDHLCYIIIENDELNLSSVHGPRNYVWQEFLGLYVL